MNHSQLTTKHERRDTSDMRRNCPLHLSRTLYKSALLCKTNPILSAVGGLQINVNIYYTKVYKNETALGRGKSKPKQTQSKPISKKPK